MDEVSTTARYRMGFTIAKWLYSQTSNRQSTVRIRQSLTHPLPRGGTDFIQTAASFPLLALMNSKPGTRNLPETMVSSSEFPGSSFGKENFKAEGDPSDSRKTNNSTAGS